MSQQNVRRLNTQNDIRHVGEYDGSKVILLGYSKGEGRVFVIRQDSLSGGDQAWLGNIVESPQAQREMYLIKTLQAERHPNGDDAYTYVVRNARSVRLPPQEVRLYSRDQAIAWFGEPSGYVIESERAAMRTRQARQVTAEQVAQPPLQPAPSVIEPPLPVPSIDAPIEVAPSPQRIFEHPTPTAAPAPHVDFFSKTVTVTAPSTGWASSLPVSPQPPTQGAEAMLSTSLELLESVKQLAAKMDRVMSFENRLRALERKEKDKKATKDQSAA